MPQKATLYQFGEETSFEQGKDGVTSVFADKEHPGVLVVVYDDVIVKYSGIPFVCSNPRKQKED